MGEEKTNALATLIDFASTVSYSDLPAQAVHETKRRIIDSLGCVAGALGDPRIGNLRRLLAKRHSLVARSGALALTLGPRLSRDAAALLNTTMIRWLDYNDTYLAKEPAHPSDNLGLLFALAGERQISGKDFILAAAIAYEIQCRLCEAASLRARGWDHVNYLLFSATLAGGRLLGMNKKQMYDAVALAVNPNIALRQSRAGETLSELKAMAAGFSVRAAATGLELAEIGFHGPDEILEGVFGFQNQVSGELDVQAFDDLGKRFSISETYLKKYPVEYHAQAVVSQALAFRDLLRHASGGRSIDEIAGEIEEIRLRTYEFARSVIGGEEKRNPATRESADHSMYFAFAAAFLEGALTARQYRPELYEDPRVRALIDRMVLEENPQFTQDYRAAREARSFPSEITVRLAGDHRSVLHFMQFPYGHPKNPMSDQEVEQKFLELAEGTYPVAPEILREFLWKLDELPDMRRLATPLLIVIP